MTHWRPMRAADLPGMVALAAIVHPGLPERIEVLAERLDLYPVGCQILPDSDDIVVGYLLSHPWHASAPPPLDSFLVSLPAAPGTYYIHDLAIHPSRHGQGAAGAILRPLLAAPICRHGAELVAVNRSTPFWHHYGFRPVASPGMAEKLSGYGPEAAFMRRPAPP